MNPNRSCFLQAALFLLLAGFANSTTFISGAVFQSHGSIGRNLLQVVNKCPVNFQFMNYTIITSKCKGPQYPADICCAAFTEFACPQADVLNDASNDCSSIMFTYLNADGNYPPGLFSSECKGDKVGLPCPAQPPNSQNADASSGYANRCFFPLITLVFGFMLRFHFEL